MPALRQEQRDAKPLTIALTPPLMSLAGWLGCTPSAEGCPTPILALTLSHTLPPLSLAGRMYAKGRGVPKDSALALKWMLKARFTFYFMAFFDA